MRILRITWVALLMLISNSVVGQKVFAAKDVTIIPKPANVTVTQGDFLFTKNTLFVVSDAYQKEIATALIQKFTKAAGWTPKISNKLPNSNYVLFKLDTSLPHEAYKLEVTSTSCILSAKDAAGFIYALESIRQLLPTVIESKSQVANVKWMIPNVIITDAPRFQWRGLMLDLSRHFFKTDYIKKTIDRLAMLKMNVLHLHLVDDQGWRMEIKKYPKLTDIGAWRVDQENVIWNARLTVNPNEKGTYGGYLTQKELKEIVKYAAAKNIEIIPEIEMPAHVSCAIAAYSELACFNQRIGVPSGGLWPITDIYCAGKETTFEFLQNIIDEVVTVFPSKYIHVGGDEATKTNWEKCPLCQKRMKDEGLKNVHELQSYFIKRMEKYINSKGKKLIGWDEILEGGLAPEATVMSWQGTQGGIEASKQGHDVVMTPQSHCYFDHYQGPQNEEPLAFGGYTPLSKVYEFDPVVDSMTPDQAQHVLGGQANLWSEYVPTTQQSEYMIFPRIAALSETLWSSKEARNWNDFTTRLPSLLERYDYLGINYSKSAYLVTASYTADLSNKKVKLVLKNEFPNADIRYVLADKSSTNNPIQYTDTISVSGTSMLQASLFKSEKSVGKVFTDTIQFHKAVGSKLTFKKPFNKNYEGDGFLSLVNVVRGSKNFHDGKWQAWLVDDMETVIDLDQTQTIHQVILGSLENQGSGIYFPTEIKAFVSNDGVVYNEVGKITQPFAINSKSELKDFVINFNAITARYVKVIATNLRKSPKGDSSFMFFDEILIN